MVTLNPKTLFLSKNSLFVISAYYFLSFTIGLAATAITIINPICSSNPMLPLVVGGSGMSLIGSSVYYMRKIYKACLSDGLHLSNESATFLKRLGTLMYLFARPLFGVGFALLVVVGMKAGIVTTTKGDVETSEGFFFMTMFFCFFAGFAAGRILNRLDTQSASIANQVIE